MDQIEDLIDIEVVAYLLDLLRGHEEWSAGVGDSRSAATKNGVLALSVLEQLGGNVAFAGKEREEVAQPLDERRGRRYADGGVGGRADGVNLSGEDCFEKLAPVGEVTVEGGHPTAARRETSAMETSARGSANAAWAATRIFSRLRSASLRLTGCGVADIVKWTASP